MVIISTAVVAFVNVLLQVSTEMAKAFLSSLKTRAGGNDDCADVWLQLQEAKNTFISHLSTSDNKS